MDVNTAVGALSSLASSHSPYPAPRPIILHPSSFTLFPSLFILLLLLFLAAPAPAALPTIDLTIEPTLLENGTDGLYDVPEGRGREHEKPVRVRIPAMRGPGAVEIAAGLRLHGNSTRMLRKKSYRLEFREEYGGRLANAGLMPVARPEIDELVLRVMGGNDWGWAMIRDSIASALGARMGVRTPAGRAVMLAINGTPQGLYQLRERVDGRWVQDHLGLRDADVVSIEFGFVPRAVAGDLEAFTAMMQFFAQLDPGAPDAMERAGRVLDLDSFINQTILRGHLGDMDWPHNNMYYVRDRTTPGAPFIAIAHDMDTVMGLGAEEAKAAVDPFEWILRDAPRPDLHDFDPPSHVVSTLVLRRLVAIPAFRDRLVRRWFDLINTVLSEEAILAEIDRQFALIAEDAARDHEIWGIPWTLESKVDDVRLFARRRTAVVIDALCRRFNVGPPVRINVRRPGAEPVMLRLNTIELRAFPWSGVYPMGIPLTLALEAPAGVKAHFAGWETDRLLADAGELGTVDIVTGPRATPTRAIAAEGSVVINEINPARGGGVASIELYNAGRRAVPIGGWRFNRGVRYQFPAGAVIPGGGYVVVQSVAPAAGEVAAFGPFEGSLAGRGETITLVDETGAERESVSYATGGRWDARAARGHSLERVAASLPARFPGAWRASAAPGGTPGAPNSVAVTAPVMISELSHQPAAPRPGEAVDIFAVVLGAAPGTAVDLRWRVDGDSDWRATPMARTRRGTDSAAEIWTARLDGAHAAGVRLQYHAEVRGGGDRFPPTAPDTNCLVAFDKVEPPDRTRSVQVLMQANHLEELYSRDVRSNDLLPVTVVTPDGRVIHHAGLRFRGNTSRLREVKNLRLELPADQPLAGQTLWNIQRISIARTWLGYDLFRRRGYPAPEVHPFPLRVNDDAWEIALRVERIDGDFLRRHFNTRAGSLLRGVSRAGLWDLGPDPEPYRPLFPVIEGDPAKAIASVIDLSSNIIDLDDEEFVRWFTARVDPERWLEFFAIQMALNNQEGGIQLDYGDDFYLWFPDGGRMMLLPWDMDDILIDESFSIWRTFMITVNRLLRHRLFVPAYIRMIEEMRLHDFDVTTVGERLDTIPQLLRPGEREEILHHVANRWQLANGEIRRRLAVTQVEPWSPVATFGPGSAWHWYYGDAPQPGWTQGDFDDTNWRRDPMPMSLRPRAGATSIAPRPANFRACRLRLPFRLEPGHYGPDHRLVLRANYEHGIIAWVNGHEVVRANMLGEPGLHEDLTYGGVSVHCAAPNGHEFFDLGAVTDHAVIGDNLLAIYWRDLPWDDSDMFLDASLLLVKRGESIAEAEDVYTVSTSHALLRGTLDQRRDSNVTINGELVASNPWEGWWSAFVELPADGAPLALASLAPDGTVAEERPLTLRREDAAAIVARRSPTPAAPRPDEPILVPVGSTLTLPAGATLTLPGGGGWRVAGRLEILGEEQAPVTLTSPDANNPALIVTLEPGAEVYARHLITRNVAFRAHGGGRIDIDRADLVTSSTLPLLETAFARQAPVLKLTTPRRMIRGLATIARVEILDPMGFPDTTIWDAEATLTAERLDTNEPVTVTPSRIEVVHGAGARTITLQVETTAPVPVRLTARWGGQSATSELMVDVNPMTFATMTRRQDIILPGGEDWTADGLNYVMGQVTIPHGTTVTVHPGAIIVLAPQAKIHVAGEFHVRGTADNPVVFLPADPAATWGQIIHMNTAGAAVYHHAWFSGGGDAGRLGHVPGPNIAAVGGSLELRGCVFTDSRVQPIWTGQAVNDVLVHRTIVNHVAQGGEPIAWNILIADSHFTHLRGPDDNDGLYIIGRGRHEIRRCVFAHVDDDGIDTSESSALIDACIIRGAADKAISLQGVNPVIRDSLLVNAATGITLSPWVTPLNLLVERTTIAGIAGEGIWYRPNPALVPTDRQLLTVRDSVIGSTGATVNPQWPHAITTIHHSLLANTGWPAQPVVDSLVPDAALQPTNVMDWIRAGRENRIARDGGPVGWSPMRRASITISNARLAAPLATVARLGAGTMLRADRVTATAAGHLFDLESGARLEWDRSPLAAGAALAGAAPESAAEILFHRTDLRGVTLPRGFGLILRDCLLDDQPTAPQPPAPRWPGDDDESPWTDRWKLVR